MPQNNFGFSSTMHDNNNNKNNRNNGNKNNNILILDHLNINHENGRHDLLKAFYFDFLNCAVDPRKEENLDSGRNTLWANIGSNQFHLPEGKPNAQVVQGVVTLTFPSIAQLLDRVDDAMIAMKNTRFNVEQVVSSLNELSVTDPWGTAFRIVECDDVEKAKDSRGKQPGAKSEGVSLTDLTFNISASSNLSGIARFYEQVLGASTTSTDDCIVVNVGPRQTLTFRRTDNHNNECEIINHAELVESNEGTMNYGAHISMYVADLSSTYDRAHKLGVTYVNPRFKRRAYNIDEAVDQCMFRLLDIVDPWDPDEGPILQLEHEVRSVTKRDGTKYKSCPFDEIPELCVK